MIVLAIILIISVLILVIGYVCIGYFIDVNETVNENTEKQPYFKTPEYDISHDCSHCKFRDIQSDHHGNIVFYCKYKGYHKIDEYDKICEKEEINDKLNNKIKNITAYL